MKISMDFITYLMVLFFCIYAIFADILYAYIMLLFSLDHINEYFLKFIIPLCFKDSCIIYVLYNIYRQKWEQHPSKSPIWVVIILISAFYPICIEIPDKVHEIFNNILYIIEYNDLGYYTFLLSTIPFVVRVLCYSSLLLETMGIVKKKLST